jgi:hypothetical protein
MKERIEEVEGCDECPFNHSNHNEDSFCWADESDGLSLLDQGKTPDWCPLKKGQIIVKLKVQ